MAPGQSLFVHGKVTGTTRFDINLICGPKHDGPDRDDIALHIAVNLEKGKFELNTLKGHQWGKEETHKINFKHGEKFDLRIHLMSDRFELYSQGSRIGYFEYRIPLSAISHIYVVGEVDLYKCSWEGRNYAVPYETALPHHAMAPGKTLYLAGVVEKKADHFFINLKIGSSDIAFHFSSRFGEKKVIRNSMAGGVWNDVEEKDGKLPFTKDHAFDITIVSEQDGFRVYVDGEPFTLFKHRMRPEQIDGLSIEGDVQLHCVYWS